MTRRDIFRRVAIAVLIGLVVGAGINEVTFAFLRADERSPRRIELVIPPGTAGQVARGEQPPDLPEEMTFVVGDTLVVHNQDSVDHQLGPLWVPAGASASLTLNLQANFVYECSFQPTRLFGLDVRLPLTLWTRLQGIVMSGVPLGILLALYAVVGWPQKKKTP
ncbi:MAG: hypothetical protein JXB85_13025 [Anaerolineales bacterium]|nr:hypothetical protein [Anaerolineales bacterium]